jgi:hypothetical protein
MNVVWSKECAPASAIRENVFNGVAYPVSVYRTGGIGAVTSENFCGLHYPPQIIAAASSPSVNFSISPLVTTNTSGQVTLIYASVEVIAYDKNGKIVFTGNAVAQGGANANLSVGPQNLSVGAACNNPSPPWCGCSYVPPLGEVDVLSRVDSGECCQVVYDLSAKGAGVGLPGHCRAEPRTSEFVFGPMVVDMEVVSLGLDVDDELMVNGQRFEPGMYPFSNSCNGAHKIPHGRVIATVMAGRTVSIQAADNHGVNLAISGKIMLRAVQIP